MDRGLVKLRDPSKQVPGRGLQAEAAAWLARLHADDRNEDDERGFRRWLAADADHVAAFEAVDQVWTIAGALSPDLRAQMSRLPLHHSHRRGIMAMLGLLVVGGVTASLLRSAGAKSTGPKSVSRSM
jgi:transmembrane sensor